MKLNATGENINLEKITKAHCLFEQSGTFKRAFERKGVKAWDYDLMNNYEETDYCTNLFDEIQRARQHKSCIFNGMQDGSLIIAFFPCTYFTDQSQLISRCDAHGMENWTLQEALNYSADKMTARATYYNMLCSLCIVALERRLPLIIENPYGRVGFLRQYFPIRPAIVDMDRRIMGDRWKKPTQYFFINCKPTFTLSPKACKKLEKIERVEDTHTFARNLITDTYADNFIKYYILGR